MADQHADEKGLARSSFDSGAKGAIAQDDVLGVWSPKEPRQTERPFHVITWTSRRSVRICHGLTVGPPIHELGGTKGDHDGRSACG